MLFVCTLSALPIGLFTRLSFSDSFSLSLDIFVTIAFGGFFLSWFRGRAKAGTVLLDAGGYPQRWLLLLCIVWFSLSALLDLFYFQPPYSRGDFIGSFSPFIKLLFVTVFAFLAFGRLQICENGIWGYSRLIRWEHISAYSWADTFTLILETNDWSSFMKGGFVIPPEHREAFSEQLLQHVNQKATPNS